MSWPNLTEISSNNNLIMSKLPVVFAFLITSARGEQCVLQELVVPQEPSKPRWLKSRLTVMPGGCSSSVASRNIFIAAQLKSGGSWRAWAKLKKFYAVKRALHWVKSCFSSLLVDLPPESDEEDWDVGLERVERRIYDSVIWIANEDKGSEIEASTVLESHPSRINPSIIRPSTFLTVALLTD